MKTKQPFDLEKFAEAYKSAKPLKVPELYILGILSLKESSGYEIYKLIASKGEGVGSWLKLNKTTTYNTINRLCKEGLVKVKKVVKDTNYPAKSIYKLTPNGKAYLKQMILDDFSGPPWVFVNFTLPLRFCKVLTNKEFQNAIKQKIQQVESVLYFSKLTYGKFFTGTILELMHENQIKLFEVELDFLKKLQSELNKKSINELFKINEFDIDKLMAKVKNITDSEVSK
jgi:DNA-binding PadR family transcriptional regulator